jgi:hypothetical protein
MYSTSERYNISHVTLSQMAIHQKNGSLDRGLERWYLVLGGVAVGRMFETRSDLELSFAEILV